MSAGRSTMVTIIRIHYHVFWIRRGWRCSWWHYRQIVRLLPSGVLGSCIRDRGAGRSHEWSMTCCINMGAAPMLTRWQNNGQATRWLPLNRAAPDQLRIEPHVTLVLSVWSRVDLYVLWACWTFGRVESLDLLGVSRLWPMQHVCWWKTKRCRHLRG